MQMQAQMQMQNFSGNMGGGMGLGMGGMGMGMGMGGVGMGMGMGMGMGAMNSGLGMGGNSELMAAQHMMMQQELQRQRLQHELLMQQAAIQQATIHQHEQGRIASLSMGQRLQAAALKLKTSNTTLRALGMSGSIGGLGNVLSAAQLGATDSDLARLLGDASGHSAGATCYKPDDLIDLVVTITKTELFQDMRCCVIVRLATARKTANGFPLDKSPQRTDLCGEATKSPEFKKSSFCFRIPAVLKDCRDKFVLRLFKIDDATQTRQVAAVGVVPLAKAAKHLIRGKAHKFKTKFKYGSKGELEDIGVIHVRVNLLNHN